MQGHELSRRGLATMPSEMRRWKKGCAKAVLVPHKLASRSAECSLSNSPRNAGLWSPPGVLPGGSNIGGFAVGR